MSEGPIKGPPKKRGPKPKLHGAVKPKRQPTGDYAVGNCRPPVHTRFVKDGPSPNARGRPRGPAVQALASPGADRSDKLVMKLYDETILVNGTEMTVIEAAHRQMQNLALNGKRERSLHKMIQIHTAVSAREHENEVAIAHGIFEYKKIWRPIFKAAEAQGKPPPNQLPHPDDLVLSRDGRWDLLVVAFDDQAVADKQALVAALKDLSAVLSLFLDRDPDEVMPSHMKREYRRLMKRFRDYNSLLPPRLKVPLPTEPWAGPSDASAKKTGLLAIDTTGCDHGPLRPAILNQQPDEGPVTSGIPDGDTLLAAERISVDLSSPEVACDALLDQPETQPGLTPGGQSDAKIDASEGAPPASSGIPQRPKLGLEW